MVEIAGDENRRFLRVCDHLRLRHGRAGGAAADTERSAGLPRRQLLFGAGRPSLLGGLLLQRRTCAASVHSGELLSRRRERARALPRRPLLSGGGEGAERVRAPLLLSGRLRATDFVSRGLAVLEARARYSRKTVRRGLLLPGWFQRLAAMRRRKLLRGGVCSARALPARHLLSHGCGGSLALPRRSLLSRPHQASLLPLLSRPEHGGDGLPAEALSQKSSNADALLSAQRPGINLRGPSVCGGHVRFNG